MDEWKEDSNLTLKIREVNTNENRDAIIEAQRKQAEGEVAVHVANTQSHDNAPGIGEHLDVTEAASSS